MSLRIVGFDAVTLQLCAKLGEMLVVTRFDRATHVHVRNIGVAKGAIVHHLFDTRASGGDLRCEIGKTTWSVANDRSESAKPAVSDETKLNHATQNIRVDIAAAEKQHAFFPGELFQFSGKTC